MTTNNHPAHAPLTSRRLHQMRDILSKAAVQRDGGGIGYAMADAVKLIDEVLSAEPVADVVAWSSPNEEHKCDIRWRRHDVAPGPLYTAPPAPVVQEELLSAMEEVLRISDRDHEAWHKVRGGIASCRASMLQAGTLTNEGTIPVTQIKPVADLYGITSPTGSETSFTFDAMEARDFIDGGWSCQEYVELERYQQASTGNSPVTPDGWVMVPVEPTQEMIDAHIEGVKSGGMQKGYRAMLAVAPDFREISNSSTKHFRENSETSTNGWIPCSERMPEADKWLFLFGREVGEECEPYVKDGYLAHNGRFYYSDGDNESFGSIFADEATVTHWTPVYMPAAPKQEVKGG